MEYVLSFITGVIGWLIIMLITTNLVGMVVRGFFDESGASKRGDITSIIFGIMGIVFVWALFRYVNFWAALAAIMLSMGRVPDLIWEIKHNKNIANKHLNGFVDYFTGSLNWIALLSMMVSAYAVISR